MKQGALGVIYDPTKTQVLLVKRRDVPVWVLPGGAIDEGETTESAVCREVKEETGLEVVVVRKIAEYIPVNSLVKPAHFFECSPVGGEIISSTSETRACAFHPLAQLPEDLFFIHKGFIEDAELGEGTVQKKLDEVSYWNLAKYFVQHPWQVIRFAWSYLR